MPAYIQNSHFGIILGLPSLAVYCSPLAAGYPADHFGLHAETAKGIQRGATAAKPGCRDTSEDINVPRPFSHAERCSENETTSACSQGE